MAQLSEDPDFKLDHKFCLKNAAKDLNNFRNVHEAESMDLERGGTYLFVDCRYNHYFGCRL